MRKKSERLGRNTSTAEVTNISSKGFWILVDDQELFVAFSRFPWFREAPVGSILAMKRPSADHLYWPALDIDISVESIISPERYPLASKSGVRQVKDRSRKVAKRKRSGL